MQPATLATDPALFGVLPILPAATSLLAVVATSLCGLIAAIISLRMSSVRSFIRICWRQKWGLATLILSAVLAIKGIEFAFAAPSATGSKPLVASNWPHFRGSLARSGHADQQPGPVRGGIQWSAGRGFDFYSSPAIVGEDVIAVGCQGDAARFFCCKAANGEQVWSIAPSGYRATFSSPVIDRGYLLCGEGLHHTKASRMTCFDLTADSEPQICGQFTTPSHIECTPAIVDGRVYFGAGDDGIYCLELPKRPVTGLREVWHLPGDKYPDAETALAVHRGRVYVGLGLGGEALCILDAESGRELHRLKLPLPMFSPPAIRGNRLYLGLGRADYVNYRDTPPGEVRCLDLATLETVWTIPTSSAVLAAVVALPEQIYFSTVDGEIVAADQQGRVAHRWSARAPMLTAPAVTDRMVYGVDCDGVLTGLNRHLEKIWSVRLGASGEYISSPVVFQGRVLVGTPDEGLLCVGEPSEITGGREAFASSGSIQPAVSNIPHDVEVAWTYSPEEHGEQAEITAPPAVSSTGIFVPLASRDGNGIARADFATDGPPQTRWRRKFPDRIGTAPSIRGEQIICLSGDTGHPGQLVAVDCESGNIRWSHAVESSPATLLIDEESIFLPTSSRSLTRIDLSGKPLWQVDLGSLNQSLQVRGSIVVAAVTNPDRLLALDYGTGRILWNVALTNPPLASPVIHETHIFIPTSEALERRSLVDGSLEKKLEGWASISSLFVDQEQMIGVTTRGEILRGTTGSAAVPRISAGADPKNIPVLGFDALLFSNDAGCLLRLPLAATGKPDSWYVPAENERIAQTLVLHDEQVYVPVAGRGLICLRARGANREP